MPTRLDLSNITLMDALDLRGQAALAVMFIVTAAGLSIQANMLRRDRDVGGRAGR